MAQNMRNVRYSFVVILLIEDSGRFFCSHSGKRGGAVGVCATILYSIVPEGNINGATSALIKIAPQKSLLRCKFELLIRTTANKGSVGSHLGPSVHETWNNMLNN